MVDDKSRRHLPPYVSYRTFRNFVDRLQQGIPARFDRSFWGETLSGSTGTHLIASLRFLGLIDANDFPTERLKRLVAARGTERQSLLRVITVDAYNFLSEGTFDLATATYAQLQEVFRDRFQPTGDVARKCIKFFVALTTDAGVPLSPHIVKRFRSSDNGTGTKLNAKKSGTKSLRNIQVPQPTVIVPQRNGWSEALLSKFPSFDPAWSEELQLSWFKAFDELLRRFPGISH
ncbi:MAG: DUF5343 domain-containing protein [Dehalococcoidales bacterium]|nr:DUF5343 domain-containing protein [Dehalococcoidales bacterium]